jgi:transcriptional regulator with XRE-family HTH domain
MLAREFGARLRALREERGLTQRELATRVKTRVSQISRYETGFCLPGAEMLVELGRVLQLDLDALLLGRKTHKEADSALVKDVRLLERIQELEKLDRQSRDTAIAMLEAIIVQGHQKAIQQRLSASPG